MDEFAVRVVPLVCPKCGADLDVPEEVSVFRCTYCGSKVQLVESSNVRGLKLLEEGVRQILEHSQTAASGVSALLQAREAEREA